jgi:hypothetical protein
MKAIGAGKIAITPTETDTGTGEMARGTASGTEMEKPRVIANGAPPKSKRRGRIRPWLLIRVIGSRRIGILEGERRLGGRWDVSVSVSLGGRVRRGWRSDACTGA